MTPEVSIIIAMYNTEKYIRECLDSLLCQTFQDYEIIIVDDCSTDNSCKIVESYLPKFYTGEGQKLQLILSKKSSNSPGVPRNKGIELARGKYIWFVDSDDAVTETALEELYTIAEKFQAEVVHCEKFFVFDDKDFTTDKNFFNANCFLCANFVSKPTFMTKKIEERIENFINKKFDWTTFTNFIRRDFLLKHNIKFPPIRSTVDSIFSIYLLCLAEKFLCVPNVVYIYRRRKNSVTDAESLEYKVQLQRFSDLLLRGISMLDKFFNEHKIFVDKPIYKFQIYTFFVEFQLPVISDVYLKVPLDEVDELVRNEFEKIDDKVTPAAIFFDYINLSFRTNNYLNDSIKKHRQYMNYQRVQVQNLKSVIKSTMPLP